MPFGLGESIGTAYVRIVADGSGLDASIRKEMDDAVDGAHLEGSGENAGRDWRKGFDKDLEKNLAKGPGVKKAGDNFNRSLANSIKAEKYFKSPNWYKFRNLAIQEFGDLGEISAKEMEREFIESGSLEGLEKAQQDFYRRTNKIRIDAAKEVEKDLLRDMEKTRNDIANITKRSNAELIKGNEAVRRSYEAISKTYIQFSHDVDHTFQSRVDKNKREGTSLGNFASKVDGLADAMGSAFGAGSRNNFVNFFGNFVTIVPRAVSAFAKFGEKFEKFGAEASETFTKAGSGMKGFSAVMEAAAPSLATGVAGIAVAFFALEAAASTLSLALGGLTAIIGTLGSGLIGGVGLLAAAMIPLAAGIGSVVIAYTNLSDAQKKAFSADVSPLTEAFGKLGDIASTQIFSGLGSELSTMVPTVNSLATATQTVTSAVRDQIDSWVALVNSGAFSTFIDTIASDLPGQIRSMGGVFQNFVTTFTGFFVGISPVLSTFLADLDRITGHFSAWINSAKGTNAVTSYFESAYESVKAIGTVLVNAGRLLGNFFRIGAEGGGNELFRSLADTFADWNDSLIENQDAIKEWVSDGADFVRTLGDIVVGIGKFVAALDTPFMRTVITALLQSVADGFTIMATAIDLSWAALQRLNPMLMPVEAGLHGLNIGLGLMGIHINDTSKQVAAASGSGGAFSGFGDSVDGIKASVRSAGQRILAFGDKVKETSGKLQATRKAAREQARSFIDIGGAASRAKDNLSKFTQFLNNQASVLEHFTQNLKKAGDNGVRKGLLKDLQELGPKGAAMVAQLAHATGDKVDEANRAWKRGQNAIKDYSKEEVKKKKIEIENQQALAEIAAVDAALNGIDDEVVNIYIRKSEIGAGKTASGGVFSGAQNRIIGEAGPEAVVPLNRPLAQVDPSVRSLSAIAQGKAAPTAQVGGTSKVVDVGGIVVYSNSEDPEAVALATLNHLIAASY